MPAYRGVSDDNNTAFNRQHEIILKEMNMKSTFRVSVCLKRYYTDIRALSYVLVSRRKTVKWLEKKIRKLFCVDGSFALTSRGHLLPSSERLGLLSADDIVEVIPNETADLPQKQICIETVRSNIVDVENETIITDECDAHAKRKQNCSPEQIFQQMELSNEYELELQNIINSEKAARPQHQCDQAVSNVNSDVNIITMDECDSGINDKILCENSSFEQQDSSGLELEQSSGDNTSMNGNTLHRKTEKLQDIILEKVKRNALQLLDNSYGIHSQGNQSVNNVGGTRKRKRVRRRRQQVVLAEMPESNFKEDCSTNNLFDGDKNHNMTESSNSIPVVAILHNEEMCIRKPRIIPSIIETT